MSQLNDDHLLTCPACGTKVMQLVPEVGLCVFCVHKGTTNRSPAVPKVSFWKRLFGGKLRRELTDQAKHGDTLIEKQLAARMLGELDNFEASKAAITKAKQDGKR